MHTDRIVRLRNDLVLWTMGQLALSLTQVGEKIIELDNRLQAQDQ